MSFSKMIGGYLFTNRSSYDTPGWKIKYARMKGRKIRTDQHKIRQYYSKRYQKSQGW